MLTTLTLALIAPLSMPVTGVQDPGQATFTLSGEVLDSRGEWVNELTVQVTRGPLHGHDGWDWPWKTVMVVDGIEREVEIPCRQHEVRTDHRGRWEVPGLTPGTYAVRVVQSDFAHVDRLVDIEDADTSLDVTLPGLGAASFRIILPEDDPAETYHLRPVLAASIGLTPRRNDFTRVLILEDGSCSLEGLPLGRHEFVLDGFDRDPSESWYGLTWSHPIGWYDVSGPNDDLHVVDLRATLPAAGRVSVEWNEALQWATPSIEPAHLEGPEGSPDGASPPTPAALPAVAPWLPRNGGVLMFRAQEGEYRISVDDPFNGWHWKDPTTFQLKRGRETDHRAQVPFTQRTIRVLDPTAAPFHGQPITWRSVHQPERLNFERRLDERGEVTLWLPPGDYVFAAAKLRGVEGHVTWSEADEVLVLALEDTTGR